MGSFCVIIQHISSTLLMSVGNAANCAALFEEIITHRKIEINLTNVLLFFVI